VVSFLLQGLTGLAGASQLFLIAAGLTVIFGVTRVVNFAHGSLYMLGAYLGWTIVSVLPRGSAWSLSAGLVGALAGLVLIGIALETILLRRIYRAPELFQLLATFGVVLIVQDLVLHIWGANERVIFRPPWLRGFAVILGDRFPTYQLALIAIGPIVLGLLWLLFTRTRWGRLVRAATQDRDMVGALGVDQRLLFTTVFALGAGLAGLAGALNLPSGSANLTMDVGAIGNAFVVVVVGGLGSLVGAYLASLLIGLLQAYGVMFLPQSTLVLAFVVMAIVLVIRPNGLLGRPQSAGPIAIATLIRPQSRLVQGAAMLLVLAAAAAPLFVGPYILAILTETAVAVIFAMSLHVAMGPGGMASFGHAAWFGIGAYAAGLATARLGAALPLTLILAPIAAGVVAALFGWFVVRLSGVYLAMLTLAFAQIVWAIAFQAVDLTGGDNGLLGIWPSGVLSNAAAYYWLTLALAAVLVWLLQRVLYAPFGYALRAARDSPMRAEAIGLDTTGIRIAAFTVSGAAAGLAGALFTFAKGAVFPSYITIPQSVDALMMVLIGGVQTITGPVVGALIYTVANDYLLQVTEYWRLCLGALILFLVLVFPQGLGGFARRFERAAHV
jgi:branched-chain amino acid transport system permease protein